MNNLYEFGEFKFDCKKQKLWHNSELILLSPKASELLALLLERNGEFVAKQEIFKTVWADTFVEDGVLTQNIYTLRKALGNDENGLPIIENKTRLGYRVNVPIFNASQELGVESRDLKVESRESRVENLSHSRLSTLDFRPFSKPFLAILVIVLIGGVFFAWRYLVPNFNSRKPIESIKFTRLTNTGNLANAAISPDGDLVAFIRNNDVFLKDIRTEKEINLDIPNVNSFGSLQFSPDGNFLYFRNNKILTTQAGVYKVSRFGGESQVIVERSWGSFSVSPDGKKIAYFLNVPPIAKFNLKIRNLETGEEKEFFAIEQPNSLCLSCAPAWSPDSTKIIFTTNIPTGTGQMFIVNLENDKKDEIKFEKLKRFEQVAWMPDGNSFIVSATEGSRFFHLWKVFYPDGETQPITNGLSNYGKISISSDGKKILTLQTDENSNLFVANAENLNDQKQLTFGNQNNVGQTGLNWIDDQKIIYSNQTEQNLAENLAVLNISDSSKISLTNEKQNSARLPTSDGKFIWFTTNKNGFANIYQMNLEDKTVKQLTDGTDGQRQSPQVTNDRKYLFYVLRGKDGSNIRRFDLQNQKEEIFFSNPDFQPGPFLELSPDNKFLTFFRMYERPNEMPFDKFNAVMAVVSTENTNDIKFFPVSAIPPVRRFSPDNKSIDYIFAETEGTQIVRQAFDGSAPKPIYTTSDGRIFNFAWSKNGKQMAISRGQQYRDAVLLTEFNK